MFFFKIGTFGANAPNMCKTVPARGIRERCRFLNRIAQRDQVGEGLITRVKTWIRGRAALLQTSQGRRQHLSDPRIAQQEAAPSSVPDRRQLASCLLAANCSLRPRSERETELRCIVLLFRQEESLEDSACRTNGCEEVPFG